MKAATIASAVPVGPALMDTALGRMGTAAPLSVKLKGVPRNWR
jgi:hypothetical protein